MHSGETALRRQLLHKHSFEGEVHTRQFADLALNTITCMRSLLEEPSSCCMLYGRSSASFNTLQHSLHAS
jgi:hypothetical protein